MKPEDIRQALSPYGLMLRGVVALSAHEIEKYSVDKRGLVALVGNVGSSYWPVFASSKEYLDGDADPLDRWSLRVAEAVAEELDAVPVFPFRGPPYLPFQQWARRAEALHQSPIGLMIHSQFGLWHSYRFALLTDGLEGSAVSEPTAPCLKCTDKPCLTTCPVDAFSAAGYDVGRCADYLRQTPSAACFQHGCMARYECPVAREYRYEDEQSQFHLRAFIGARKG